LILKNLFFSHHIGRAKKCVLAPQRKEKRAVLFLFSVLVYLCAAFISGNVLSSDCRLMKEKHPKSLNRFDQ
jgi:hypothetical protein